MAASAKEQNVTLANHLERTRELCFEAKITANATPALKKQSSDLPGVAILRTEGLTALADAVEAVAFTTAVDNSTGDSQFGILIKGSELGEIEKVLSVEVVEQTALATSISFADVGSSYLTAGGNIAIDIAGTGLNLASESPTLLVTVKYLKKI